MSTPPPSTEPAPPPSPPVPPAPPAPPSAPGRSFFALPRRDFFVGGVAGLIAGKVATWVQPLEWTQKELPDGTQFSFSQFGEDLVIRGLFEPLGVARPSYLDIGAYDPIRSNNTYLFYRGGGRGVLIEPNVALTDRLRRKRPGDTLLVAGIGIDDAPEADYYVLDNDQMNTFDKDQVDRLVREHRVDVVNVVKMPLLNINRVMAEHFGGGAPDLLSIDIEGLDYEVLRTLDFSRFRPKVICAETLITGTMRHNPRSAALLAEKGYELRGLTPPNAIFVDARLIRG
ncbi:FkbM family methyltransferase [Gemmata sp.]|uniref:FkbM family methyltransferase n=1 Tax=Gemmata sp. TaxID=1914242 RepID=UPI003F6EAA20